MLLERPLRYRDAILLVSLVRLLVRSFSTIQIFFRVVSRLGGLIRSRASLVVNIELKSFYSQKVDSIKAFYSPVLLLVKLLSGQSLSIRSSLTQNFFIGTVIVTAEPLYCLNKINSTQLVVQAVLYNYSSQYNQAQDLAYYYLSRAFALG